MTMPRSLLRMAATAASSLPVCPFEITELSMQPSPSVSPIEVCLASFSTSAIVLNSVPALLHANRPLEVVLAAAGFGRDAANLARWISSHALLHLEIAGQSIASTPVPILTRLSDDGWIARALICPAAWSAVASVTVVSLTLAGRLVPSDRLPTTLRVGYNHAPAPAGAVYAAAQVGDMQALQAALDAGGSTAEACEVRDSPPYLYRLVFL